MAAKLVKFTLKMKHFILGSDIRYWLLVIGLLIKSLRDFIKLITDS